MGLTLNDWGMYKLEEWEKTKRVAGELPPLKAVAKSIPGPAAPSGMRPAD